jgi:uncharacterized repeat protein (TIGR03803 family)
MSRRKFSLGFTLALVIVAAHLATSTRVVAQQEKVLHNFGSGKDGEVPYAGLTRDSAGNLYGTTYYGGTGGCASSLANGCGTVFELSPNAGGGWTEKILHDFNNNGKDGYYPDAGLVLDHAGNLYGTTSYGGTGTCNSTAPTGCGTVFELIPREDGDWAEYVLHSFAGGADGEIPEGGVILDAAGNLYGTTAGIVGNCTHPAYVDCGTVFELTSHAGGGWTEKVLHSFSSTGSDGYGPYGNLVRDSAGKLYGGAYWGGAWGDGAAFELTPAKEGTWTEQIIYSFFYKGNSGGGPGGLVFDTAGNLYASIPIGGSSYSGAVIELTPATGSWTETTLYNFDVYSSGSYTNYGLILDSAGNLYGTNQYGGSGENVCLVFGDGNEEASCGTAFELTPNGDGSWNQTTLHSFGTGPDGEVPYAGMIRDGEGNFYGTTASGGAHGGGTVFEIKP